MDWWLWVALGVGFLVAEVFTAGAFYFFFFGVSGVLVGLAVGAVIAISRPQLLPDWAQWLGFAGMAIAMLTLLRPPLVRAFAGRWKRPPVDSLVGEAGKILEAPLAGAVGRMELRGTTWQVKSVDGSALAVGEQVVVMALDGLTLIVKKGGVA